MAIQDKVNRRNFLTTLCGGASALVVGPDIAPAQKAPTALYGPALERQIAALEQRARTVGLPEPPTPRLVRPATTIRRDNSYREALPRLLELIDRSERGGRSVEVGEGAAELLSKLHRQEYGWARTPGPGPDTRALLAPSLESVRNEYRRMFDACKIREEYTTDVVGNLSKLRGDRARYEALGNEVQIPWYFVGIIHGLEASFNFMGHLHNGDVPLSRRTRTEPKNRPDPWLPPSDWESSAKDALKYDGFLGQTDWSLEPMIYRWEAYNGWGYRPRRNPSPYLWSFSDQYSRGKFASDGHYDPQLKSQQCGAVVMLKELMRAGDVAQL